MRLQLQNQCLVYRIRIGQFTGMLKVELASLGGIREARGVFSGIIVRKEGRCREAWGHRGMLLYYKYIGRENYHSWSCKNNF